MIGFVVKTLFHKSSFFTSLGKIMVLQISSSIMVLEVSKEWLSSKIIWIHTRISPRHTTNHITYKIRLDAIGNELSLRPPTHGDELIFPIMHGSPLTYGDTLHETAIGNRPSLRLPTHGDELISPTTCGSPLTYGSTLHKTGITLCPLWKLLGVLRRQSARRMDALNKKDPSHSLFPGLEGGEFQWFNGKHD